MYTSELQAKHYEMLEKRYGVDKDAFERIVRENGDDLDKLSNEMLIDEIDEPIIQDILDFLSLTLDDRD